MNIGSVTSDIVDITEISPNQRIEVWERLGIDGIASRDIAKGGGAFIALCTKFDSNTSIDTWIANLEALQNGALKSGEDSHGTTFSNMIVLSVELIEKSGVIYAGSAKVMGVVKLTGKVAPA